jgi:hypothetical protein
VEKGKVHNTQGIHQCYWDYAGQKVITITILLITIIQGAPYGPTESFLKHKNNLELVLKGAVIWSYILNG